MKVSMHKTKSLVKTLLSTILSVGVLFAASAAQADENIVSQKPLMLSVGVPPNIILTLDESGSMSWGYIPDTGMTSYVNLIGSYHNRRYHAHNTNPMAYNPHVVYQIPPAFEEDGSKKTLTTSFSNAPANGFGAMHNSNNPRIDLATEYRPIHEHRIPLRGPNYAYHPSDSSGGWTSRNPNDSGSYTAAYYYEFDSSLASCTGSIDDTYAGGEDCYRYKKVDASSAYDRNGAPLKDSDGNTVDGRDNFAIWYSFYRSRALATLSAASIAFYDLDGQVRFTWQNLKSCSFQELSYSERNSLPACNANGLRQYGEKHRGEFYSWLRGLYFNVGTPLPAAMKRAGELLKKNEPWLLEPGGTGNTAENTYACRPSYHVLMTDGMWNETTTAPTDYVSDTSTFKTPGGLKDEENGEYEQYPPMQYSQQKPFYDNSSGRTLADYAMHYWATDLRPDLANRVPTHVPYKNSDVNKEYWDPRNNPAEWQHMTNFIMGLGLTTSLDNPNISWEGRTHAGSGYERLASGNSSWPAASSGSANNVYDLWHAAINSRGEFYSVDTPGAMVAAFRDIIDRIAVRQSTAALPAISSSIEEDSDNAELSNLVSYFYQSSYDSNTWTGDLVKQKKEISFPDGLRKEVVSEEWRASAKLPDHSRRNIKMVKNGSLVDFNVTNATDELKNALKQSHLGSPSIDDRWKERLNYLRGDRSAETGKDAFRQRATLLGDFLGSKPIVVSGARYLAGVANKIEDNKKYTDFVTSKKNRRPQIYVGGNAGMLHAFDANTGEEKFAFVPTAVFDKLYNLANPEYNHFYYVDGTPEVADVYDKAKGEWRTILVGTLGAGGKGIFALDITNPDDIELLWEIGPGNSDFQDMGYSIPKPTIARLHSGEWAVVTGNGYGAEGHTDGKAALYAINALGGSLIKSFKITGEVKQDGKIVANGLSTPKLVDFDADGVADYAYAGDLQGNLWRFDLLGSNADGASIYGDKMGGTGNFKVSYGSKPVFTAKASNGGLQPITAPPSIVRHPHRTGYLVVFGTGKYVGSNDKGGITSYAQSVYGIWDKKTKAEATPNALNISRSNLQGQAFENEVIAENTVAGVEREARLLSQNAVQWTTQNGWRLDLSVGAGYAGEMVVDDMTSVGTTLLLSTLLPNDDPCAHGAGSWLYAINPATGGRTERHVFDTRYKDGNLMKVVSGIKFGDLGGVPLNFTQGGLEIPSSAGSEGINIADMTGRQTWRAVPNP